MLYTPIPTLADENAWLGFYGSIVGAIIAGIVTLWGIEYTIKTTILNVKPKIRPVRTKLFLYHNQEGEIFITNQSLNIISEEYAKNFNIHIDETHKIYYSSMLRELVEAHKGTACDTAFAEIDLEELYKKIGDLCAYKTYNEALEILYVELPKLFGNGVGQELFNKIKKRISQDIELFVMLNNSHSHVFYSIYNVGAGNAIDVRVQWDFSKKTYSQLCSQLGFTDKEYEDMQLSCFFNKDSILEADIMLNTNGENKINVEVPIEIVQFIKWIYSKSLQNIRVKKHIQNNALGRENPIAELVITCVDIHGETHIERYSVLFKIIPTLQTIYNMPEECFYLKFDEIGNKHHALENPS